MAKLEEIIKTETSRSDSRTFSKIHLFKEGAFLRAYEQSAWLMSRHAAAELTPKRHKTKLTADGTFVFVGFPMTSLDKYRPEHSQDIPYDETHFILDLPADTFPEEVVDLEDMDSDINIMDLGLNEFRLDLLAYMKDDPDIEHTPFGMSAVVPASATAQPGVIFILKNRNNAVNIGRQNLLHPFYMVYLGYDGGMILNHLSPKRLLDVMRSACKGRSEPVMELCHEFNRETQDGRNMTRYSELLQQAVASIVEQKAESDLESLFSFGETTALVGDIVGLDDFELICFLVIGSSHLKAFNP